MNQSDRDAIELVYSQSPYNPCKPKLASFITSGGSAIRLIASHDIDLPNHSRTSHHHGDGNNRNIVPREIPRADVDALPMQNIPPEQARQRGAKRNAKRAVVDADSHAVDRCPERAVRYRDAAIPVDGLPCLYNPAEEDGRPNISTRELLSLVS